MRTALLARHGESEYSARGLTNGDPSVPVALTALGREQAAELGRKLRDRRIDLCLTSQFPRAQETADIALAGRDVPRLVVAELNDIRYGELEGQPRAAYQHFVRDHTTSTPLPGGESKVQVAGRVGQGLEIALARPEECILIVAHELVIGMILRALRNGVPVGDPHDIEYATAYPISAAEASRAAAILTGWRG